MTTLDSSIDKVVGVEENEDSRFKDYTQVTSFEVFVESIKSFIHRLQKSQEGKN